MQPSLRIQDSDARAPTGAPAAAMAIEVAARHAARRGVEVRTVLPRAPGVVAAVRDAAAAAGVVSSAFAASAQVTRSSAYAVLASRASHARAPGG
jgi:hypothetical protein